MDESRFGLHTKSRKGLTAKGVQPICPFQQVFKYTYLFSAFSPIDGNQFQLELPACNSEMFQLYLDEFSKTNPLEYKIIVLDNGAFHKAKSLIIPENISLLFLPPYSPELNPAEKIWQFIKRKFTNKYFQSLDEISIFFQDVIPTLEPDLIKSICGYKYISTETFWSG